jgi:hypothetical protein
VELRYKKTHHFGVAFKDFLRIIPSKFKKSIEEQINSTHLIMEIKGTVPKEVLDVCLFFNGLKSVATKWIVLDGTLRFWSRRQGFFVELNFSSAIIMFSSESKHPRFDPIFFN